MSLHLSRRARRIVTHGALGLGLAATLGVAGPAGTVSASAAPDCDPGEHAGHSEHAGESLARVGAGTDPAVEPNALSAAEVESFERQFQGQVLRMRKAGALPAYGTAEPIVIKTHVHILKNDKGKGGVSKKKVKKQIKVLNEAYAGETSPQSDASAFQFELKSIDVTKKTRWWNWKLKANGEETKNAKRAKRKLHKGGMDALNMYFANLDGGLLGYATFPWFEQAKLDGVVMHRGTVPGGSAAPYNEGDTGTHEVGHWMGLYHTFQGSCDDTDDGGDFVADTGAQFAGNNIFVCDPSLDTCPLEAGNDPVRNFMNYVDDDCMDRFTPGQNQRQWDAWWAFRAPVV